MWSEFVCITYVPPQPHWCGTDSSPTSELSPEMVQRSGKQTCSAGSWNCRPVSEQSHPQIPEWSRVPPSPSCTYVWEWNRSVNNRPYHWFTSSSVMTNIRTQNSKKILSSCGEVNCTCMHAYPSCTKHNCMNAYILVDREALVVPRHHDFIQTLLNVEFLVGWAHYVRDGVGKVVQLHGKEVLQSERLGVHVKVLPSGLHQLLPVPIKTKVTNMYIHVQVTRQMHTFESRTLNHNHNTYVSLLRV